jgi:hypothetical protein
MTQQEIEAELRTLERLEQAHIRAIEQLTTQLQTLGELKAGLIEARCLLLRGA